MNMYICIYIIKKNINNHKIMCVYIYIYIVIKVMYCCIYRYIHSYKYIHKSDLTQVYE